MHPLPIDPSTRIQEEAERLAADWDADERWQGIDRPYGPEEVVRLRGSLRSSTRSPGSAPSGSGGCCTTSGTSPRSAR